MMAVRRAMLISAGVASMLPGEPCNITGTWAHATDPHMRIFPATGHNGHNAEPATTSGLHNSLPGGEPPPTALATPNTLLNIPFPIPS